MEKVLAAITDLTTIRQAMSLISTNNRSWDRPSENDPSVYSGIRRGIERALANIAFSNQNQDEWIPA